MSDVKPKTTDTIDILMAEGDSLEYRDLVDKIEDLHAKNSHKIYDKFELELVKDSKLGWALSFCGEREETNVETAQRETEEVSKRKRIEAAELKEYLRLHKIYGKKKK